MSAIARDDAASAAEAVAVHNARVTWEGCSVLLDINDGDRLVFCRLSPAATVKIGNNNYSLRPLIGCPFGSLFQVDSGADGPFLSRVDPSSQGKEVPDSIDESKDNRALVDNNKAQTLTGEDINAMRSQGATGDEIVEALIANSATFENKTSFSQEKYRLKKQKKYAPKILVRRPFTRSICEAYFKKYPHRIGFLRVDTLSLLLSMANVTANSNILVVDTLSGILTGAVAERLGGHGHVCSAYMGGTPYSLDIVRMFNFSSEICKRIVSCSISDLSTTDTANSENNGKHVAATESQPMTLQPSDMEDVTVSLEKETSYNLTETNGSFNLKPCKSSKAGEPASAEVVRMWKESGFSSLIIGAPDIDPWSIIKGLLPLLSHSAPFAIYHQYLQPLATCMHNIQQEKLAIGLQINEPWLREFQVLPARTHPHMQMSAFGGYILSGTKICGSAG
uniref:tRNA (adenine(58)-N(1))-methyltransferase non-catalytic subunit TRM6 n=1 Tax=Kalanchoe fedtschenkoi TaxID=63787 RepID=A0A7N0TZQ5_KALFE